MRGVAQITAATIVAEIGDLGRFDTPAGSWRISGSYLPSIPAVRRSGVVASPRPECPSPSAASRERMDLLSFSARQRGDAAPSGGLDLSIVKIAWKAQLRLHNRYYMIAGWLHLGDWSSDRPCFARRSMMRRPSRLLCSIGGGAG